VRDTGGAGFWHEPYVMRGGMEAIYDDVDRPLGLMQEDVSPTPCLAAPARATPPSPSRLAC
jgi:hypothetical protein